MVVFVDGRPEKARYRTYKVRAPARAAGAATARIDFASMYEVLSRRFRRAGAERPGTVRAKRTMSDIVGSYPGPAIVIDSGKGQLGMALAAARDVGIDVRPGVGLADRRAREGARRRRIEGDDQRYAAEARPGRRPTGRRRRGPPEARTQRAARGQNCRPHRAARFRSRGPPRMPFQKARSHPKKPDRVFLPHAKDAIPIRPSSAEMFVLQALRDEAHRFAVSFHRGQRRRLTLRSALSDIPGIGPGRQRQLLRHFGSIKRVRAASVDELAAVPGISRSIAEAVHAHWAKQPLDAGVVEPQATAEAAAAEQPHAEEQAIEAAFADGKNDSRETA